MGFRLDAARAAGYSDAEIAAFLAQRAGLDLQRAREAGWSDQEIAADLAQRVGGGEAERESAAERQEPPAVAAEPARTAATPARGRRADPNWIVPSSGREAARSLGVGARGAMQMVGALPGALYDIAALPVRGVAALAGVSGPRSSQQHIDTAADALGLPQAETPLERGINRVGQEVGAMGVGLGAGRGLMALGAMTGPRDRVSRGLRAVGDALSTHPGSQTAGAVGAGVLGAAASEASPDNPLMDFGAAITGGLAGAAAVPITAATARGLGTAFRVFTPAGAQEAAAAAMLRASDDGRTLPGRLRREYQGLEGSAPTSAELSGDSGLLQLERAVRNQPEGGPLFNQRDMGRDAVRARAIEDLAPGLPGEGSGAENVARGVTEAGDRVRAAAAQGEASAVAAAEARAAERAAAADAALARRQGRVQAVGAGRERQVAGSLDTLPAGQVPEAAGPIIREEADAAARAAREGVNDAFARVDPEGESRLPLGSILAVLEQTRDRLFRPLGSPVPREVNDLVDELRNAIAADVRGGTAPFDNLSALRSRLNDMMDRFSGGTAGNSRAVAVLKAAKDELDAVSRRAAEPFELPTQPRTQRDIGVEHGLEAAAQHPDVVRALADVAMDPRAWSAGQPGDGRSLLAMLRGAGGVRNTGGEMRHMMSRSSAYPGLWNNRGLSIHQAMERAIEDGYFPGRTIGDLTEQEFLDAMREGLRGRHIYPGGMAAGDAAGGAGTRAGFVDDVARAVEQRGGRYVPGDPDETLASLRQASDDPLDRGWGPHEAPPGQPGFVVDPRAEGWAFTPEQAARYRAAIDAGAEEGRLFRRGAMDRVLGRGEGGSRSPDSVVAQQFFHGGDSGASDMQQFVAAIGDRPRAVAALEGYAAQSLRDYAWGADGVLTASRVRAWLNRHRAALRQMPEVAAKFADVDTAVRTAEASAARGEALVRGAERTRSGALRAAESDRRAEVRAAGREARREVSEFERGAARYWLRGTEPEVAIERALSAGNAEQNIRELRVLMHGDAPALRGLRRAYGEAWLSRIRNTNAMHADESRKLRSDAARRWVEDTERAARVLFNGDELDRVQQIARDFHSGSMVSSVGRAAGSNTAQNLASIKSMTTAYFLGRVSNGLIRGDAGALPMTIARPVQFLLRMQEQQVVAALADLMLDPVRAAALTEKVSAKNLEMVRRYAERSASARASEAVGSAGVRATARAVGSVEAGEAQREARRGAGGYAAGGVVDEAPRLAVRRHMAGVSGRGPHDDGASPVGRFMLPAERDDVDAVERIPASRFQVPYAPEDEAAQVLPAGVSGRQPRARGGPDDRGRPSAEGPAVVRRGVEGARDLAAEFLVPGPIDAALAVAAPQVLGGRLAAKVVGGLGRLGMAGWRGRGAVAGAIGAQDPLWGGGVRGFQDGGRVGRVARGLGAVGEGIRAFHGSPHRFDRFDISRIGSGEGAQAYGHGLYFAEHEPIARHYRNALSHADGESLRIDGVPFRDLQADTRGDPARAQAIRRLEEIGYRRGITRRDGEDFDASLRSSLDQEARDVVDRTERDIRNWHRAPEGSLARAFSLDELHEELAQARAIQRELRGLSQSRFEWQQPGAMYEVRLHADPDRMLDWDRPLAEQPAGRVVRDVLGGVSRQVYPGDVESGSAAYHMLGERHPGRPRDGSSGAFLASQALRDAGVPGIRYLDGVARRTGQDRRNFVMFDDEPIEIVRRYRDGGQVGGAFEGLVGRDGGARYQDGGRVGLLARGLGAVGDTLDRALREGVARRTPQNPRGLPMDADARRARAEAMGFDVDRRYLHATHSDFSGFDPARAGSGANAAMEGERAVFLTDAPAVADSYLAGYHVRREAFPDAVPISDDVGRLYAPEARVLPVVLRGRDDMVEWDMDGARYDPSLVARVFRDARSEDAPGAIMEQFRDPGMMVAGPLGSGAQRSEVVAVFDPARLRSPHATFDPMRGGEADLLAGVGGGLAGAAGAGAAFEGRDGGARYAAGGLADAPGFDGGGRVGRVAQALDGPWMERLRRMLDARPIGVQAPQDAAEAILRQGRFRTQFETGTSRGSMSGRPEIEEMLWGHPRDMPEEQRQVYGAIRTAVPEERPRPMANWEAAPWTMQPHYGDHLFLLRPEVKARSTHTYDDSFALHPEWAAGLLPGLDRPFRFGELPDPEALARAMGRRNRLVEEMVGADGLPWTMNYLRSPYIETQTPGPVTAGEISALIVPGHGGREDAIRDYAGSRGIPVHRHDDVLADQDLQRHLGLRVVSGAIGAGAAFEGLVGRDGGVRYAAGGLANAPGPEDDIAATQGAASRGLAQAQQMWLAAGRVLGA